MLVIAALEGCAVWLAHGTFTQVSLIVSPNVTILKQFGFPLAGIFSLVLMLAMQANTASLHDSVLGWWFAISGVISAIGWLTWILYTCCSSRVTERFNRRDIGLFESNDGDSSSRPLMGGDDAEATTSIGPEELQQLKRQFDWELAKLMGTSIVRTACVVFFLLYEVSWCILATN